MWSKQMNQRPNLNLKLDSKTFRQYYYLKKELTDFCRQNNLQTSGTKMELTDRIATFLESGERTYKKHPKKTTRRDMDITPDLLIEENFVCTQKHRLFYRKHIGNSFSFNVQFQKWLKSNAGKTYEDSIRAYHQIIDDKKKNKPAIGKQFEYNTYVRDFFEANRDKTLEEAIKCWKYKKSLKGHNKYEKEDLTVL